jgi:tRNA (guanine37-N1)-methyltransferase
MSGHHAEIEKWRRERVLESTQRKRPELLQKAREAGWLSKADETFLKQLK